MKINESYSPVFNRPFVRITDGAEETGDYLFVDIEVRQAIALRDALLAKYPVERWEPVSEEIVVSATGVGEAFARKDRRIAQLEAQVAEMQPAYDAVNGLGAYLYDKSRVRTVSVEICPVWVDDEAGGMFDGYKLEIVLGTDYELAHGFTLAAAIDAALAQVEGE